MMIILTWQLLSLFTAHSLSQSVKHLGSAGGDGPEGGLGDPHNPVLKAQSFITDALIPLEPNTTRQLAKGKPPGLVRDHTNATTACPPPRRVIIDSANGARQEMVGFGFSWTDSSVEVINRLTPELQDQVMRELFSQKGNNMGTMRHTVGSSDLSGRQYSFDDNGPSFNEGEPDLELQNFDIGEDGRAMAKMIARMGKYKSDVFLIGAPWSYPGWMKHNGLFVAPNLNPEVGGVYMIMNNSFDAQYIPQAASYFEKYLDAYKDHGVSVNALSLQNEPLNYQGGTTAMYLDPADAAAILNHGLGALLNDRNIAFFAYDHNTDQTAYPMVMTQRAPKYVDAAAWHCYAHLANYSAMDDFHYAYPDKPQFMTECSSYLPKTGSIDWQVANAFMPSIQHGASGANMWVLATDPDYGPHSPYGGCAVCQGAVIVNSSSSYMRTNNYYMVGQFSRFIRRGSTAYKIVKGNEGSHLSPNQFNAFAAQNSDQSWAIVFVNNMNRTENVRLSFIGSDNVWEGVVPNATVTTWIVPCAKVLGGDRNDNTTSPASYLFANGTSAWNGPTGTGRASSEICKFPPVTTTASSSASSSSTPRVPVPNQRHVVEQNVLGLETNKENRYC